MYIIRNITELDGLINAIIMSIHKEFITMHACSADVKESRKPIFFLTNVIISMRVNYSPFQAILYYKQSILYMHLPIITIYRREMETTIHINVPMDIRGQ